MRFSIAAVLGLAALATAQSSAPNSTHSSTQSVSATTSSVNPETTCLAKCGAADICCQARCVNVPCPSELQANATTDCAARCPQGNGTQQETEQYAACQQKCISSYFFSTATAAAATGSGSAGSSGATTTGGSSASRTGSGSASSTASATQNAAPEVRFGAAGVGLIGLFIAGLAL